MFVQQAFDPVISPNLKIMDRRIFQDEKMNLKLFGSLTDRCIYHPDDHVLFIDLFGVSLLTKEEVDLMASYFDEIMAPLTKQKGPLDVVVNYDGFDLRSGLEELWAEHMNIFQQKYYKKVRRYAGRAFRCAELKRSLAMNTFDANEMFVKMDQDGDGVLSREELRAGIRKFFGVRIRPSELDDLFKSGDVTEHNFADIVGDCLRNCGLELNYRPVTF